MWEWGKKVTTSYSINCNPFSRAMVSPLLTENPTPGGAHFQPPGQFSKRHPQLTDCPFRIKTKEERKDWEYSSFHRYVRNGIYDLEWAAGQDIAFGIAVGKENIGKT